MTFAEIGCEQSRLIFKGSDSRVTPTVGAFSFLVAIRFISGAGQKGGRQGRAFPSRFTLGNMVVAHDYEQRNSSRGAYARLLSNNEENQESM